MLLGTSKRHAEALPAGLTGGSSKRHKTKPNSKPQPESVTRGPAGGPNIASLDDDDATEPPWALPNIAVYRPGAHLHDHPSDVQLVSGDKLQGFQLHKFLLRMRSPVLAAMLSGAPGADAGSDAISLPEDGAGLKLFFRALYSNAPDTLIAPANIVGLTRLAHKYACDELLDLCWNQLGRLLREKEVLWTETTVTLPQFLLLAQECSNEKALALVLDAPTKKLARFVAPVLAVAAAAKEQARMALCPHHPSQLASTCVYGCRNVQPPTAPAPAVLAFSQPELATLAKLNGDTLGRIVERLIFASPTKAPRTTPPYY
jgi:hypothetical protein